VSRRRRRARACACAMLDVGQQAGYGLYTGRVAKPLTYMFTYACAWIVHVHTASHQARSMRARARARTHIRTYGHIAPPFSAAVPISGGTASERSIGRTRGVDFQSSSHLRFSPFFHSIVFHRFTGCPPNFAPKLFYVRRIQVTRRILINNMTTDLCAPLPIVPPFLSMSSNHTNWLLYQLAAS